MRVWTQKSHPSRPQEARRLVSDSLGSQAACNPAGSSAILRLPGDSRVPPRRAVGGLNELVIVKHLDQPGRARLVFPVIVLSSVLTTSSVGGQGMEGSLPQLSPGPAHIPRGAGVAQGPEQRGQTWNPREQSFGRASPLCTPSQLPLDRCLPGPLPAARPGQGPLLAGCTGAC